MPLGQDKCERLGTQEIDTGSGAVDKNMVLTMRKDDYGR
jgi:hypothetical protein